MTQQMKKQTTPTNRPARQAPKSLWQRYRNLTEFMVIIGATVTFLAWSATPQYSLLDLAVMFVFWVFLAPLLLLAVDRVFHHRTSIVSTQAAEATPPSTGIGRAGAAKLILGAHAAFLGLAYLFTGSNVVEALRVVTAVDVAILYCIGFFKLRRAIHFDQPKIRKKHKGAHGWFIAVGIIVGFVLTCYWIAGLYPMVLSGVVNNFGTSAAATVDSYYFTSTITGSAKYGGYTYKVQGPKNGQTMVVNLRYNGHVVVVEVPVSDASSYEKLYTEIKSSQPVPVRYLRGLPKIMTFNGNDVSS